MARRLTLAALSLAMVFAGGARAQGFDPDPFDRLLMQHVQSGLVDYDAFAASADLEASLRSLAAFDPTTLARDDELAFWINAYHAYTIKLIIKHGERRSIRFIARYYPAGPERDLLETGTAMLEYVDDDWTLNSPEQARRRADAAAR